MGGFRVGYAIGNSELIASLRQIKTIVDFNQYEGILRGAMAALASPEAKVRQTVDIFQQRRDIFIAALKQIGWSIVSPPATMYVWAALPEPWQQQSVNFCKQLVAQTGVAAAPGAGFGSAGEGYVRFALVQDTSTLQQAVARIAPFLHT